MSEPRLLLVEDNPADARMVRELLKDCRGNFNVVQCTRLETALQTASTQDIEVMLLDLTLPDSTGLETVRRACTAAPGLPIVVMTGYGDEEVALRAVSEGAQDYLVKGEIEPALLERSLIYAIERKAFERQLQHDALHDALTGLPNRRLLLERISQAMVRHHRGSAPFAVLAISLDNYRAITGSYGHSISDRWIASLSRRLSGLLQQGDTLARVGAKQLTALIEVADVSAALPLAERIQQELRRPLKVGREELFTTASIGITTSDIRHERPEHHLRDAVAAMGQAKARGGGRHQVFDAPMHARIVTRLQLEKEFRRAIERDELEPHYQPLIWLHTGEIAGFESLVRWRHAERGLIYPGEFIEIAEEAGLMPAMFERLLPKVLAQTEAWQQERPSLLMNINLSPSQLAQPELLELFVWELSKVRISPFSLGIEITENILVEDDEAAAAVLQQIKQMKIRVLLDDFGVGYSSLSCLHRFPIDGIKIDRSFIARLGDEDGGGPEIVRALVHLANGLGMSTTAEGIETPDQLRFVRTLGCDLGQGYFFGRPRSASECSSALEQGYPTVVSPTMSGPISADAHSRGRVMLVTTDPERRTRLRLQLDQAGYEVQPVASGAECIDQAPRGLPDVILLDVHMPNYEGLETCRRLKETGELSSIPVLLLAGDSEEDPAALEALRVGGSDVVAVGAPVAVLCARLDSQVTAARAQARLRRVAMTDDLTGVFSRGFVFGALRRTLKSLSRQGRGGVGVLLADVDHFTRFTAAGGHRAGDLLLSQIARAIDGSSRDSDMVARFGGEQFIVVLSDVDEAGARFVAERIRSAVELRCQNTVSIGGAYIDHIPPGFLEDGLELDELIEVLIRAADRAMYEAKRGGRNRVVFGERPLDERLEADSSQTR